MFAGELMVWSTGVRAIMLTISASTLLHRSGLYLAKAKGRNRAAFICAFHVAMLRKTTDLQAAAA